MIIYPSSLPPVPPATNVSAQGQTVPSSSLSLLQSHSYLTQEFAALTLNSGSGTTAGARSRMAAPVDIGSAWTSQSPAPGYQQQQLPPPTQEDPDTPMTPSFPTSHPAPSLSHQPLPTTYHTRNLPTTLLPLRVLLRPILPVLDTAKVDSMFCTLTSPVPPADIYTSTATSVVPGHLPPIDVLYYKDKDTGKEFFFAFGGCHRLRAYEIAGREMVECKVLKVTRGMLAGYLGGSLEAVLGER